MAMEVTRYSRDYDSSYAEQLKEKQQAEKAEKAEKAERAEKAEQDKKSAAKASEEASAVYISSEESGAKPSGLYRVGQDENGSRRVFYDDPKKPADKCTTDTSGVDREIKNLKAQKKQLEQQIKAASGDEKKIRELEKKLEQIDHQLSQKDNDTYRRQNASVSE